VQDNEVGDGTTSVTVLACELLRVCIHVALSKGFVVIGNITVVGPGTLAYFIGLIN